MAGLPEPSSSNSSDLFGPDDTFFLEALQNSVLPGDVNAPQGSIDQRISQPQDQRSNGHSSSVDSGDVSVEAPPCAQPGLKRQRSPESENDGPSQAFTLPRLADVGDSSYLDEHTYGASRFGEMGEYMRRKRAKLQIQNTEMDDGDQEDSRKSQLFKGLAIYVRSAVIIIS